MAPKTAKSDILVCILTTYFHETADPSQCTPSPRQARSTLSSRSFLPVCNFLVAPFLLPTCLAANAHRIFVETGGILHGLVSIVDGALREFHTRGEGLKHFSSSSCPPYHRVSPLPFRSPGEVAERGSDNDEASKAHIICVQRLTVRQSSWTESFDVAFLPLMKTVGIGATRLPVQARTR